MNRDLWVFFTHSFILPLLHWLPNGFAVHALAGSIVALLVLAGSWGLTGLLGQSTTARLLSMLMLSCGISLAMAEHVYGQAAYGAIYYMACFLLLSHWAMLHGSGRRRWGWAGLTVVLSALVFWANPQRALIYYGLPLLSATLALALADRAAVRRGQAVPPLRLRWLAAPGAGLVLGSALHGYTLLHVNASAGLTNMLWLDFNGMLGHLRGTVLGLLATFDALPDAGTPVVKPYGAYQLARMLGGLVLVALLPWAIVKSCDPRQRARLFLGVFTATGLGLTLVFMLSTTLVDLAIPEGAARYLVPFLLLALLLLVGLLVDQRDLAPRLRWAGLGAVALLATSGPFAYFTPYRAYFPAVPPALTLPTDAVQLTRFLEAHQLHYGYSTFWLAGRLSVISEQRVRVRQIVLQDGMPLPMRFLSSNRWYRPAAWQGDTFLMLPDAQAQELDLATLGKQVGAPRRILHFAGYTIWVFAGNLARLPAWNDDARSPHKVAVSAASPHRIGHFQAEPEALAAGSQENGLLYFGPAIPYLLHGSYEASFDLEAEGANIADFGKVDVLSGDGRPQGESLIRHAGRQQLRVRFSSQRPISNLELRVLKQPGGQLKVYGMELRRVSAP
ncbi:hypothetical protein [Massilia sp. erpn]|uniref:hypothetical protein n=1 Tax=Massilia sp. erpn TaxID=2738142 RepID=UPI002107D45A|nr:hypothetical protein [Massilia sp. erpn]UTY58018.1 hypothetical protein HPQ68_13005 [Massilia sp. erpn]